MYGNLKLQLQIKKLFLVGLKDPGFVSFIYECEY